MGAQKRNSSTPRAVPARKIIKVSVQGPLVKVVRLTDKELLQKVRQPLRKVQVRASLRSGTLNNDLLRRALNISAAQLKTRLAGSGSLIPAEGERVILTEQLIAHGTSAFGDREVFMAWLREKSPALDHERPIDLIGTTTGMGLVLDELTSIAHGLPL